MFQGKNVIWCILILPWISYAQFVGPYFCSSNGSVAPPQKTLDKVLTNSTRISGDPWGLVYASRQKNIAFVGLTSPLGRKQRNGTLGILDTSTFTPSLIHQIQLPLPYVIEYGPGEIALTHNGKYVIVSAGPGGVVVDTALAAQGSNNAVVGVLNGTTSLQRPGNESLDVAVSLDDKYAFFSQEFQMDPGDLYGNINVVELIPNATNMSFSGQAIGYLNLSIGVVGSALSPDGCTLYATSEQVARDVYHGSLAVIDAKQLVVDPSRALVSNLTVGCGLVRAIVSADSKTVWVTSREDNTLLAFDAAKLRSDPAHALRANVTVGTSPVSLIFVRNETRILIANSNRFYLPNATAGISVVNVEDALAGNSARSLLGQIPSGFFPRQLALSGDGQTVLVSNFESGEIESIDVSCLP